MPVGREALDAREASWATSDMILSVNGTIAWRPINLSTTEAAPSATMAPNATSAARRASGSDEPRVSASTRCPENTGMNRSAMVAPSRPPATIRPRPGCFSQCRNTKGSTTRMAAGLFDREVMTLSGRFRRGPAPSTDASPPRRADRRHSQLILTWEVERSGLVTRSNLAEGASNRPRTYRTRRSSSAGVRSANATKSCKSLPGWLQ